MDMRPDTSFTKHNLLMDRVTKLCTAINEKGSIHIIYKIETETENEFAYGRISISTNTRNPFAEGTDLLFKYKRRRLLNEPNFSLRDKPKGIPIDDISEYIWQLMHEKKEDLQYQVLLQKQKHGHDLLNNILARVINKKSNAE